MPFLYPILLLSPFIIFCPRVFKIPYHLFARILLLQHITTPPPRFRDTYYIRGWKHKETLCCPKIYNITRMSLERRFETQRDLMMATSHTTQEPWPRNYGSPKESVLRPSPTPSKSRSVVTDPQVYCEVICDQALNQMLFQWTSIIVSPRTW